MTARNAQKATTPKVSSQLPNSDPPGPFHLHACGKASKFDLSVHNRSHENWLPSFSISFGTREGRFQCMKAGFSA
jgi:hypothetical protein